MDRGWFKVYRKIEDCGWYKDSQYVHLWIHLLKKANHKETEILWNDKIIKLQPGQFITGRKKLEEETGINQSKIERILKVFKTEQQIEQQKTNKYRLISILSWDKYQNGEQQFEQPVNNKRTTDEQQMNTDKNVRTKELKNDKNNTPLQVRAFAQLWNDTFKETNISTVNIEKLTGSRKKKIRLRLKEESDLVYWKTLFEKLKTLPFYMGKNDKCWQVSFDYMITNDNNHVKIHEKKARNTGYNYDPIDEAPNALELACQRQDEEEAAEREEAKRNEPNRV